MKNTKINTVCFSSILIGIFFLRYFSSFAQDTLLFTTNKNVFINGFIKDLQSVSFIDDLNSMITGNYIHNRINFKWKINDNLRLRIDSRNRLYYGEQVKSTPGFGNYIDTDNGLFDLTHNIISDTSIVFNTSIDRAMFNWSKNKLDVAIGRQRINWGINLVWNPNDIFNTFNYFDFDYEERPGTDAIRIQYNTGLFSSFQVAYKPVKSKDKQVVALMYKTNLGKYDWQNFLGLYEQDVVVGTGWAGNIKQIGFKGEATYFHSYKVTNTNGIFVSSISLDRMFKGNCFIVAAYLYNSNGKDIFYALVDISKLNLSVKNLMPFKHTFFAQLSKSITPVVNVSFSSMFSTTKNSLILFPTFSFSLSDNWDLSLIAQSFFAEVNNSFRTIGNTVYLRLRWSY